MFSAEAMKSVCKIESEKIRSHPHFDSFAYCHDSWTLGAYVALLNNKTSCEDIDDSDVDSVRGLLGRCAPYYLDDSLTDDCSDEGSKSCAGIPAECKTHDAVFVILNYLTPSSFASDIDDSLRLTVVFLPIDVYWYWYETQDIYLDKMHDKRLADEFVTLKAVYFDIKFAIFEIFLFSDLVYVGVGMLVILLLIWAYTASFLIMLAALLNFIMSLVLSYFFYVVVFDRPFFPFVNITAIIMVIGIGADDTFVLMDLWRQSLLEHRGKRLVFIVGESLRHAWKTMFVTSATTTGALFASMITDIPAVKCFSLFAGLTILMNFALTMSWLPAVILLQYRLTEKCCKSSKDDTPSICTRTLDYILVTPSRVFFHKILPFIIVKFKYVWLIVFSLLGIAGVLLVFYKPGLQLPSSSEFQILNKENYLEQYDLVYKEKFAFESSGKPRMTGRVIFGVQSSYSGDPWDPDDFGRTVLDDSFAFSTTEHQVWMQQFCSDIRNQSFYHSIKYYGCFLESLRWFMLNRSCNNITRPCCSDEAFPYQPDVLETCLRECVVLGYCAGVKYSSATGDLVAVDIDFESTTYLSFDYGRMEEYWTTVDSWMQEQINEAPSSLSNGWFISNSNELQLWFYDLQKSLATGTPISLGITIALAFVILNFTILNVVLAVFAIVTVAFVVCVTMGSLVLLGWELNIFESVIFTLAVGLSVDFTIHYGVAYTLSRSKNRSERAEFSVQTMGSAITIAYISTFLAGALMSPATVNSYLQLGTFLMLVMSISFVYSTFFFQSLCIVFGPQGKVGQLNACCTDDPPQATSDRSLKVPVVTGNTPTKADRVDVQVEDNQDVLNKSQNYVMNPNKPDIVPSLPGTPNGSGRQFDGAITGDAGDPSMDSPSRMNPAYNPAFVE